jgi:hypothetical protein
MKTRWSLLMTLWLACLTTAQAAPAEGASAPKGVAQGATPAAATSTTTTTATTTATVSTPPPTATEAAIETTRRSARSSAEWLARGVDGWFGDTPFEDGGKVSDGRFNIGLYKRRDQSAHLDVRFNAHFRLPNFEKNAYLFIGRDDPREVIRDTPNAVAGQQRLLSDRPGDRSFLGGLGVSVVNALDLRIGFGARLKPYVQARYDKPWAVADGQVIDFRETVFWSRADRWGATTALSYEVTVSPTLVGRWLNAATITQTSRNFAWSSTLGAYQAMGYQRLLSLELLANGTGNNGNDNSPAGSSDLGVLVKWEQPVYKNWLLGEMVAGHFWPRPDADTPRGRAWALGAGLKMLF